MISNGSSDGALMRTSAHQSEQCRLFLFIVDSVLTGGLCLFGFAANTASFLTLWQDKLSSTTYLLEAVLVCDLAILWMIFLGDCVPSLGWALHVLSDCRQICDYVAEVTKPLLHLSQVCAIWLSLVMLIKRYLSMCRYGATSSVGTLQYSLSRTTRCVLCTVILGTVITVPLTIEKHLQITVHHGNVTLSQRLHDVHWYQLVYHGLIDTLLVYVVPLILQLVLLVRLACIVQSVSQLRHTLAASFRLHHIDVTQLVLTLSVTMVICYAPLIIEKSLLWIRRDQSLDCGTLGFYLRSFCRLFVALNSSIKILLLSVFVDNFKQRLAEVLTCLYPDKRQDRASVDYSMYRCADMSEMTLISNVDSRS